MDSLEDKLLELKELLEKGMKNSGLGGVGSVKAGAVLPSISKMPKPGNASQAGKVGIPGQASTSKVNPIKSAEQTQNKDIKDIKMKEAHAELAMKKGEGEDLYHIHENGIKVTSSPISLKEINDKHGGVKKLEGSGFRVIQHKPEEVKFAKNGQWSLEELEKSGYKGYTPEDNARRKANNTSETTGIHTMDSIKQYGGSGPSAAAKEAKEMRAKSKKNPVKVYTKEEIDAMNEEMNKEEHRPMYEYKGPKGAAKSHIADAKRHIANKDYHNAKKALNWAREAVDRRLPVASEKPKEIPGEPTKTMEMDKTENRTTAVPGVSDMGVEVRRSNPKDTSYSKVVSPEKHGETAKEIARTNIKQTSQIKPKLPK